MESKPCIQISVHAKILKFRHEFFILNLERFCSYNMLAVLLQSLFDHELDHSN
jgi:hypothetical protein